jgi:hypothetical protein
VAGVEDLEPSESLSALDISNLVSTKVPRAGLGSVEGLLSGPLHVVGPGASSHVVADEIISSRVDQDGDIGRQNGGDIDGKVGDPVTEELSVDEHVAVRPTCLGVNVQGSLNLRLGQELIDGREIVAERRNLAGNADIINVLQ